MADHSENNLENDPTGLGIISEEEDLHQSDSSDGQRDVDHLFSEGFTSITDETEHEQQQQHNGTLLHVETNTAPVESDDAQPVSAFSFSSSSSEEDEDADDEGDDQEEGEQDADEDQFEDAEEQYEDAPGQSVYPVPAVLGTSHNDLLWKPNNRGDGLITFHVSDSSDSEGRKKQKNIGRRPSPLRTASSPDSPVSPKKASPGAEGEAGQIGVLPEPSPVEEDQYVVSPIEDNDRTPRPGSALGLRPYASGHDWSEDEEDEDDESWLGAALDEVKHGSRRVGQVPSPAVGENLGDGENNGDAVDEPEADDDQTTTQEPREEPTSPVSPLSPENNTESGSRSIIPLKRPFGFHLTTIETSPMDVEDGIASSSDVPDGESIPTEESGPTEDTPEAHDPLSASGTFKPVFDGVDDQAQQESPTSPDPTGPEPFTGMTPQDGINAWWRAQAERSQARGVFRTNRNYRNEDRTGDLTPMSDSEDKLSAADHLLQQRLKLKNEEGEKRYVFDLPSDVGSSKDSMEATKEYLKLQMLKYRWQRNDYYRRGTAFMREAREYQDEVQEMAERVGRRDRTIQDLDESLIGATEAYESVCKDLEKLNDLSQSKQRNVERLERDLKNLEKDLKKSDQHVTLYKRSAALNAESMRQMRAARDAPLTFSTIQTVISEAPEQGTSNLMSDLDSDSDTDAGFELAIATPRRRRPAPEHEINWPLEDRLRLVPFMTEWINDHREHGSREELLLPEQLDQILDAGFISWDEFIERLRQLGYTIRPDHLAGQLTNLQVIRAYNLPPPNLAVMYAARRLNGDTAVAELLREIASLQDQLTDRHDELAEAPNFRTKIYNLELTIAGLEVAARERLNVENVYVELQTEIAGLKEELETARAPRITDCDTQSSNLLEFGVQTILDDFIQSTNPTKQIEGGKSDAETKLENCQKHGQQLESRISKLTEELQDSETVCASMTDEISTLSQKIEDLEAQLAEGPSAESDGAMIDQLKAEIQKLKDELKKTEKQLEKRKNLELELMDCQTHGNDLRTRIAELEEQLIEINEMTGQANSGLSSELSDRLAASEQHAQDLQEKIDELESRLDPFSGWRDGPDSISQAKQDEQNEHAAVIRDLFAATNETSLLKLENEELRREIKALKDAPEGEEGEEDNKSKASSEEGVASPQKETEEAKESCDEVRAENAGLREELRKLKENYQQICQLGTQADQEQEDELNSLKDELDDIRDTLDKITGNNQALTAELEEERQTVRDLQEDLRQEREGGGGEEDDLTELREDLEEANEANASLLAEVGELKAEVERLQEAALERELQEAFDQSDKSDDVPEKDDESHEKDSQEDENDSLEQELEEARQEISWLKSINKAQSDQLEALKEESSSQKPESQQTYSTKQGTQTDPTPASSAQFLPAQPARSPIGAATQPARWSIRETNIRQAQNFIDGQQQRRLVRERRQAAERAELEIIQSRMAANFGVEELPYIPKESRFLPVVGAMVRWVGAQ